MRRTSAPEQLALSHAVFQVSAMYGLSRGEIATPTIFRNYGCARLSSCRDELRLRGCRRHRWSAPALWRVRVRQAPRTRSGSNHGHQYHRLLSARWYHGSSAWHAGSSANGHWFLRRVYNVFDLQRRCGKSGASWSNLAGGGPCAVVQYPVGRCSSCWA